MILFKLPHAMGAQCNATSNEAPAGAAIEISDVTNTLNLGYI